MKSSLALVLAISAPMVMAIPTLAAEQTLYCGSALISLGDTSSRVLEACGRPTQVNTSYVERELSIAARSGRVAAQMAEREMVPVERWRYDARSNQLPRLIVIKDGVVTEIVSGP